MTEPSGDAPALGGGDDGGLAPALGSKAPRGKRAWWNNLKGPIAVLLADFADPHPRVRRRAVEALGRLGDRRATSALTQGLRDPAWEVRLACLHALVKLGAGTAPLARATRDGHPPVRRAAAEALAAHGDARDVPALEAMVAYLAATAQDADRQHAEAALAALQTRLSR